MSAATMYTSRCSGLFTSRMPAAVRPLPARASGVCRRSTVRVAAFRDDSKISSKVNKASNQVSSKFNKASNQVSSKFNKATSKLNKQVSGSSSTGRNKQRTVLPPKAPRNEKENAESVVWFVAVASLFLTGVLFVFPALLGGSPATTKPLQTGINKTFGIKEPADTSGPSYAPGPGPAAAPGSPATRM